MTDIIQNPANYSSLSLRGTDQGDVVRSVSTTEGMVICESYTIDTGATITPTFHGIIIIASREIIINGTLSVNEVNDSPFGVGGVSATGGDVGVGATAGGAGGLQANGFSRAIAYIGVPETHADHDGNLLAGGRGGNIAGGSLGGGGLGGSGGGGGWFQGGTGATSGAGTGGTFVDGGLGGGWIVLQAPKITFGANGLISSRGGDGSIIPLVAGTNRFGCSGGGAGGTIIIVTDQNMGTTGTSPPANFDVGGGTGGGTSGGIGGTATTPNGGPGGVTIVGGTTIQGGGGGAYGQLIFRTMGGVQA